MNRRQATMMCVFSAAAVGGLVGCEDELPPAPTTTTAAKTAEKKQELPKNIQVDDYQYSSIGKRDPFRPFYLDQQSEEQKREKEKTRSELEGFDLDQLKLVAIMAGTSQPMAMFEDPTGKGHIVTLNTPIGRNSGRVNKIKTDEVVIVEELKEPNGKKVLSPLTIKMPGDELVLDGK